MKRRPVKRRLSAATLGLSALMLLPHGPARAQTVAELQKQINELKEMIRAQAAAQGRPAARGAGTRSDSVRRTDAGTFPAAGRPVESAVLKPAKLTSAERANLHPFVLERPDTWLDALLPPPLAPLEDDHGSPRTWFEKLSIRGYTQLRGAEFLGKGANAPSPFSRLRNFNDGGITPFNNFSFRRVRLIIQGDIHERVFLYIQPDFATAVSGQSVGEPRQSFAQLRDAFADVFLDDERRMKIRFGQQKVPYGWENLQSSQNRLALDRTDAINSAVPSERDIGVTLFYTPWHVQAIWDRLAKGGQKLFGNYGAFALGAYNGQTINRVEANNDLMTVGMVTWPFELDGLGPWAKGQVLELGGSAYRNEFNPEIRAGTALLPAGGLSAISYREARVALHAILYPQPFGLQAEWNWGVGPEFDPVRRIIESKPLQGGYVQAMYKVDDSPVGPFYPYLRYQTYDGGIKSILNAPRLTTDEVEVGIEFQPIKQLELTLAYNRSKRREPDERRIGRAEADLFRGQLQWNY